MEVGPLPPPDPDGIWMRTEPSSSRSWKAPEPYRMSPESEHFARYCTGSECRSGFCQPAATAEVFAETVTRTDRWITSLVLDGFAVQHRVTATEEPGRVTMLARIHDRQQAGRAAEWCSHCQVPGHVISRCPEVGWLQPERAWRGWSPPVPPGPEQDKIDAYFRGEPAADTLAQARKKWLDGTVGIGEFLAAVDRADLPELDRLPGASWWRTWWRRLLLRVLRAVAGRRGVV